MFGMHQAYADPLAMIVGAAPGMMVPAPGGVPMGGGGGCGIPNQCPPLAYCPTQSPQFYGQAASAAVAAQAPQSTLGINSLDQAPNTQIATLTPRTLTSRPSVPMCITKFVVDRGIASFFQLSSIKVAKTEYLSDGQSVPADGYTADTTSPPLKLPMLYTGTDINVGTFNKSAEAHHFFAEFRGFDGPGCYPCL